MSEFEAAMDYLGEILPYQHYGTWRVESPGARASAQFSFLDIGYLRVFHNGDKIMGYFHDYKIGRLFNYGPFSLGDPEFFEKMVDVVEDSFNRYKGLPSRGSPGLRVQGRRF